MINEQLKTILGEDTTLTEQHINQLAEAFSGELVKQKVAQAEAHTAELATINEQHTAAIAEAVEVANARLDECVELAVEKVLEEHSQKFIDADTFGRMTAAFAVIQEAFEKNGFALNENAAKDELQARLDESESQYKSLFDKNTALKNELTEAKDELELAKRSIIFESLTRDLADTTKEKVGALVESVNFESLDEFITGLRLIVEQTAKKDDKEAKDGDGDGKKDDDKDGDDDDNDKSKKAKPAFMKESRKPLSEMTSEERLAYYRGQK